MASTTAGSKRKRDEPKLYAVHIGQTPGIYNTYAECQEQTRGVKGAIFKSFTTREEAESFVKHGLFRPSGGPTKYYGVRTGKVPGVYTDWPSAQQQITGVKGPQYKSFPTRVEAEAYVADVSGTNDAKLKGAAKSKKQRDTVPAPEADEIDETVPPGLGPLPKGSEDGFDRRIKLNKDTGLVEYKSDGQLKAIKMQAMGVAKGQPVHIYTDGSSRKNGTAGARAGVGVYFGPLDSRNVSEPLKGPRQTNQRAELTACQRALDIAPRDADVIIFTDSKYSISCLTDWFISWRRNDWVTKDKKPVENRDLIEPILRRIDERKLMRADTKFEWVQGHAGNVGNVAADHLAVNGAREGEFMEMDP